MEVIQKTIKNVGIYKQNVDNIYILDRKTVTLKKNNLKS